jgi:hypothetical protein
MPREVFKIEDGRFGLSVSAPPAGTACEALAEDYDAFTCQVTSGALVASPNVTQETIEATWCDPEEQVPQVAATSYTLELSYLQDPHIRLGLSRFLYEHDAELVYFFMGLDGDNPPKAIGQLRVTSGSFGGAARTALTASTTLPCDGKPQVCFGDEDLSDAVGGTGDSSGAQAGTPGLWTPVGSEPPADVATLIAGDVTPNPATAWTTGQYVQTQTSGTGGRAYWDGDEWVAGAAP